MYTRYRGYILKGRADREGWRVRVTPSRPDVPILSRGYVVGASLDEAIAKAESCIDRLLSASFATA